jgi:hypothetical protein
MMTSGRPVQIPCRRVTRRRGIAASRGIAGLVMALLLPCAVLLAPAPAHAQVERFALVIGNNLGGPDDVALRYAEDDAGKIYAVLENLGGFRPENMLLLRGRGADEVRDALIAMNERIRRQAGAGRPDTMLFVYYSGHADAQALHLASSELSLRQVEQLVTGSAAEFRVLVLDACRSGALTRVKGGRRAPPVSISLEDQLAGEGTVFLTASSANEDAQESDQIKGSFFTHYLVSGLIGAADQNQDGRVVLEEAYRYAYEHTLRASSRTLAGTQHPTFKYDMRGQGQVVLTQVMPRQHRALVHLPAGRSYLLLRDGPEGPVVAEVGARDQVRRISVAAGRYFVRGRAPSYLLEGTVHLSGGNEQTINDVQLDRIEYARFVRKGATDLRAVHGPQAGLRSRSAVFAGASCMGPYLGYAWETRHFDLIPRVGLCRGLDETVRDDALNSTPRSVRASEIDLGVRLARTWDVSRLALSIGVTPGLALISDAAEVQGGVSQRYRTVGVLGSTVGVAMDLSGPLYVSLEIGAQTYVQRKRTLIYDSTLLWPVLIDVRDEVDADVVLGLSAGAGVRW